MKYIDADKLKAEIERLQERAERYEEISLTDGERSYWSGEKGVLELLATFIASLQQEQPGADFDEEFDKFHIGIYNPFNSGTEIYEFARHFYELGKRAQGEQTEKEINL